MSDVIPVEVAAMLGDSVVEVKQCSDPRSGALRIATWATLGASLVGLAVAAGAFVSGVGVATRNAEALARWTTVLHKPAHAFRPERPSGALAPLELFGLGGGLALGGLALARARRERRSPGFRIGTAPGVDAAVAEAPRTSFPLVAPAADGQGFTLQLAPGIDGELLAGGGGIPFSQLIAEGRARPSLALAGAHELPIDADTRIRARAGRATFFIRGGARPQPLAGAPFAIDGALGGGVAAAAALLLGLVGIASLGTPDSATVGIDTAQREDLSIHTTSTDCEGFPPPSDDHPDQAPGGGDSGGGHMALPDGAAGAPTASQDSGHLEVKDNHRDLAIARAEAMEVARTSGILGDTAAISESIAMLGGTEDLSSGVDGANVYGPMFGADGAGRGQFGGGRNGWGPGGGCGGLDCGGVGAGNFHTIGAGPGTGTGWAMNPGPGGGRGHNATIPSVVIPLPSTIGDIDPAIIRRYIRREQNKISYCYEHQLLAHPTLAGSVSVRFLIGPTGTVQSAVGEGLDPEVASCVADVIHAIEFPRPHDGGNIQVTYPFHFQLAGAQR